MSDKAVTVAKREKLELPANIKIFLPALVALVAVSLITSLFSNVFFTSRNVLNVINQATTTGIMGVGITFILTAGKFDLSSGASVCLTGLISASLCADHGVHPLLAIGIALALGALIGVFNGFLVAYVGLIPFIATMGTMNMLKGISLIYSKSLSVHSIPRLYTMWGDSKLFGFLPSGIVVTILLYIVGYIVLTKSVFGHKVSSIGGNTEAAKLAGIDVKKTVVLAYILAGVCYAIAGVMLTGRVGAAYPSAADGSELEVIAGVVIGGTAMTGGKGSHIGTYIGILLVALINNAINLLGISAYATKLVQGMVILIAVIAEVLRTKYSARKL